MEGEGVFWLNFELKKKKQKKKQKKKKKKKKKTKKKNPLDEKTFRMLNFFNHTSSLTGNIVDEEVTGGG